MILLFLDTLLAVALLLAWGMATWRVSRLGVRDDSTRFRRTARTGMIFLMLGVVLGVARLITTGLLWFTSGWWFAADRVLLALPLLLVPIIAALVLSGPRLRRLAQTAPESPLGGALREAAISPALVVPLRVAALAAATGTVLAGNRRLRGAAGPLCCRIVVLVTAALPVASSARATRAA